MFQILLTLFSLPMNTPQIEKSLPIQHKNGRFENPWDTWQGLPGVTNFLRWTFTRKRRNHTLNYDIELPVMTPNFSQNQNGFSATWLGHSTILVQMAGLVFITDPVFSSRVSPIGGLIGPIRVRKTPCSISDLPKLDAVIISHNHLDHLDLPSVKEINSRFGDQVSWYVPLGMKNWFLNTGCKEVHEKTWWQETKIVKNGFDFTIVALPAQHWSTRSMFDKNKSLWCSWAVLGPQNNRFFFAGDTGYCPAFRSIGHFYGPFTLAAIPIGVYEPRYALQNQHVDPKHAVKIHQDIRSQSSLGIHWGTYEMGSIEDFLEPKTELAIEAAKKNLCPNEFFTLKHGETWVKPEN